MILSNSITWPLCCPTLSCGLNLTLRSHVKHASPLLLSLNYQNPNKYFTWLACWLHHLKRSYEACHSAHSSSVRSSWSWPPWMLMLWFTSFSRGFHVLLPQVHHASCRLDRVECHNSDTNFLPLRACAPMLFNIWKTSSIHHVKHKYNDSSVWYDFSNLTTYICMENIQIKYL
jgi:hypothetical protein